MPIFLFFVHYAHSRFFFLAPLTVFQIRKIKEQNGIYFVIEMYNSLSHFSSLFSLFPLLILRL